jgi:hypothetical protein
MSSRSRGIKEMTIQSDTAIVPFQGIVHPVRNIDPKIMRYADGNRLRREDPDVVRYGSDQAGSNYGKLGHELKGTSSLGENIDIYI